MPKMIIFFSMIILSCVLGLGARHYATRAQSDPLDEFKGQFGFSLWPNKNGALKPGLRFDLKDFKGLGGFKISSDERIVSSDAKSVVRKVSLVKANEKERLSLEIEVSKDSTDDAQRALLAKIVRTQVGPESNAYKSTALLGVSLGDVAFIPSGFTAATLGNVGGVDFVRNNVRIGILRFEDTKVDVFDLAKQVDDKINAEQNYSAGQLTAFLPVISSFYPKEASIKPNSLTELVLSSSDPFGGVLEIRFDSTLGKIVTEQTGSSTKTIFYSNHKTGTALLTVYCINDALLLQKASTNVTISP